MLLCVAAALLSGCAAWKSPASTNSTSTSTATAIVTGQPTASAIGYAAAGPHMDVLSRGGNFPTASRTTWWRPAFSVDGFSRLDQLLPANFVAKADSPSMWLRDRSLPAFTYTGTPRLGAGRFTLADYLKRNPATGLLIAQGDRILFEQYQYSRTDSQRLTSFSMAKTITAMLIGIAVEEGHIRSIDDSAETYVPGLKGTEYGKTSLRHLLTMSSGVRFREVYDGNDDAARLSQATIGRRSPGGASAVAQFNERYAAPGESWSYASAETYVLGLVLKAAVGRPVAAYLEEKIWRPIGAEADASWLIDQGGNEVAHAFFNAVLRDYARFGMLLAQGGKWGDRQIIPAHWVAEATRAHFSGDQTFRWFGYGYQTWIFPDGSGCFALLGVRGQAIFVDPAKRLVLVHTAVRSDARDPAGADLTALWRGLRSAI